MTCLCRAKNTAKHKWGRIHLVDKCLLIILFILMLQSALNLFLRESSPQEMNSIDVVIRTSAAGIFGYLVSANFDQQRKRAKPGPASTPSAGVPPVSVPSAEVPQGAVQSRIGFDAGGGAPSFTTAGAPPGSSASPPQERKNCDRAQIIIVAAVGIVSLCVLLIYRNFFTGTAGAAGVLTQFRDFVSGSVGFLISSSTSGTGAKD